MTGPHDAHLAALMQAAARAVDAGNDAAAEPLFQQIVSVNPRDAEAWHMLGVVAVRNGHAPEAIEALKRALALDRRNPIFLNTLGIAHGELAQTDEALSCFKRALRERPDYADAHYNLGKLNRKLGKAAEAEQCYIRARRLDPRNARVANNLATLYSRQGRWEEALALLLEARLSLPHNEILAINLAMARLATGGPDASIAELSSFAEHHPSAAAVRAELARRLLAEGRFAEGWRQYGWRHGRAPVDFPEYAGKRVLLLPDQGLGDHLFFLRFAHALRERAGRVAFACPEKLFTLLTANPPVELHRGGHDAGSFDFSLPLGDLPYLLDARDTPEPLRLSVAPERIAQWRERLGALGPPPYLGVTWRAGTTRQDPSEFAAKGEDPLYKEIDIAGLASGVRAWPGTILMLQRRPGNGEAIRFSEALGRSAHDLSAVNDDLADVAAVLFLIEEYVGVSNTNMHLRAGLAKTARVLVPFPAEFRWMHAGDEVPWFPGFRVYRQPASRDWGPALACLKCHLTR